MAKIAEKFDVCIVGSGAGAGPIAYELSRAGAKVCILEKGDHYTKDDFSKDEIAYTRRDIVTPLLYDEYHIIERLDPSGWTSTSTQVGGENFWNGNVVGGSSNFMSGFFHRLHPKDFKQKSELNEIQDSNIVDWPISYDDLEPYYEKVERVVGVSGEIRDYKYLEPRSTNNLPFPPTDEHPISKIIDDKLHEAGISPLVMSRAILSKDTLDRKACYYSKFCANYGCNSGAKGSSREALLEVAQKSGNLTILDNSHVIKLEKGEDGLVNKAIYFDKRSKKKKEVKAKIFVVAAQAIESSRLLLNSDNLANSSGEVGKNLIFGGILSLAYGKIDNSVMNLKSLMIKGPFINRTVKDWYFLDKTEKGGTLDFLFKHENPIVRASSHMYENNKIIWGKELQEKINYEFNNSRTLNIEVFNDFIPNDNCFVTIDKNNTDFLGMPVAKIRIFSHKHTNKTNKKLVKKAVKLLEVIGAKDIASHSLPHNPPKNLQGGGCRFGNDPKTSVLNKYCQSHDVENLFVTDGSFMPTGGSVPFTWTIYANSFRVADYIKNNILNINL